MKRYMLEVAYDGTNYCGWQVQPNGITIEEMLNKHLSELLKEDITVICAIIGNLKHISFHVSFLSNNPTHQVHLYFSNYTLPLLFHF